MTHSTTSPFSIFLIFLKLGLTSFGGPIAHLGYFRHEFVERRKWLSDHTYSELVALCQFLPGPASSQVGMALGLSRGGYAGAIAAWVGFTLPSAILLILFGLGYASLSDRFGTGWLNGLKIAAVAVVAQALVGMARQLCPDVPRLALAACAAAIALLMPTTLGQVTAIALGGIIGWRLLTPSATLPHSGLSVRISRRSGSIALGLFALLLVALPATASLNGAYLVQMLDGFYRAGALVFGGGHVVLPLLQSQVVPNSWVSQDAFLAGYGAAQAVPGPLFSFAAYLGSISTGQPSSWVGGMIALVAIFLPSFLLVVGVLPFWERLRSFGAMQRAMLGINAAVVGLLLAAFLHPICTEGLHSWTDVALAVVAFMLLQFGKIPAWAMVFLLALTGIMVS